MKTFLIILYIQMNYNKIRNKKWRNTFDNLIKNSKNTVKNTVNSKCKLLN